MLRKDLHTHSPLLSSTGDIIICYTHTRGRCMLLPVDIYRWRPCLRSCARSAAEAWVQCCPQTYSSCTLLPMCMQPSFKRRCALANDSTVLGSGPLLGLSTSCPSIELESMVPTLTSVRVLKGINCRKSCPRVCPAREVYGVNENRRELDTPGKSCCRVTRAIDLEDASYVPMAASKTVLTEIKVLPLGRRTRPSVPGTRP